MVKFKRNSQYYHIVVSKLASIFQSTEVEPMQVDVASSSPVSALSVCKESNTVLVVPFTGSILMNNNEFGY